MTIHRGTCHCGAVAFEAELDVTTATRCNCSICTKLMWTGVNIKPAQFRLLKGEGDLGSYAWGHKVSTRYFCKHCGTPVFGKGHLDVLGGDFVGINCNTLDDADPHALALRHWDGRHNNWQAGPRDAPYPIA